MTHDEVMTTYDQTIAGMDRLRLAFEEIGLAARQAAEAFQKMGAVIYLASSSALESWRRENMSRFNQMPIAEQLRWVAYMIERPIWHPVTLYRWCEATIDAQPKMPY